MKKLTFHPKIQIGGCYFKKSFSALKIFNNKNKAFTLIELLVVIAIIGILAGVVIASLNSARTSGRVAAIKSNLKNFQTQAQLYHLDNGTFAGLCGQVSNLNNYAALGTPQGYHSSIQPMIDALTSIAGANNVRCIVRTASVPSTGATHFIPADSLETKNFGVAVYFNETHYAVDTTGVVTLDSADNGGATNWQVAMDRCATAGKRLPSIEILKAINDYGAQGESETTNLGFLADGYWSSTLSASSYAYNQYFPDGGVYRGATTSSGHVRCAA